VRPVRRAASAVRTVLHPWIRTGLCRVRISFIATWQRQRRHRLSTHPV